MSRQLELIESQREAATRIALEAKLLTMCQWHHEVFSARESDYTPGYKVGNYLITKGEFPGVFDPDDRDKMTVKFRPPKGALPYKLFAEYCRLRYEARNRYVQIMLEEESLSPPAHT